MSTTLRTRLKWWLFPGVNLHARLRYRRLPMFFGDAAGNSRPRVLDAGSGNGMLGYQAWRRGREVTCVTFKPNEVRGCRELFNDYLRIPESELRFLEGNLYEMDFPAESFDEIICSEVLEHLREDKWVCRSFVNLLKPGGVLQLCAPNAEHPYNATFAIDPEEKGGHVRPGYTLASYRALLEPLGFEIAESAGLGGPVRQAFNRRIKDVQGRFGAWSGVPLFAIALLFLPFESRRREANMPFSIYVKAVKQR